MLVKKFADGDHSFRRRDFLRSRYFNMGMRPSTPRRMRPIFFLWVNTTRAATNRANTLYITSCSFHIHKTLMGNDRAAKIELNET